MMGNYPQVNVVGYCSGASSKFASWNDVALRQSSSHGSAAISSTRLYPRSRGGILESVKVKAFTFNELSMATSNFSPENFLGEGSIGRTYKGWIDETTLAPSRSSRGMVVAVKRLKKQEAYMDIEWLAKVNFIGQLSHPHLVKLIGYCLEDEHPLLVYEFLPGGSLENRLLRNGRGIEPLPWNTRMKIALGVAEGLKFLHSHAQIIPRDLNTANVLLDVDNTAKISDFGLVKHGRIEVQRLEPYIAPEYIVTGRFTAKTDVYSFGVVLSQLLSGRHAIGYQYHRRYSRAEMAAYLASQCLSEDPFPGTEYSLSFPVVEKAAELASRCLSDPRQRPSMKQVVKVLKQLLDAKETNKKLSLSYYGSSKRRLHSGLVWYRSRRSSSPS
ncbi:putative serine/threonine-protein kinase NAK [Dichanthelium oligosanthes]|uniref:non-specific serine/threonine protein kinase n=1 Tax=Dichanthelium oligosanthes TaxID=888268 RepID=A0A1E5UR25_9POAL|nr:putative serine/threonine-protein kinase NAK [Dichanthelium oligosanthes]